MQIYEIVLKKLLLQAISFVKNFNKIVTTYKRRECQLIRCLRRLFLQKAG